MSVLDALQTNVKAAGETRNVAVNFAGKLDTGELLTGVPAVTAAPTGLTLSNIAVNTSTLTINGSTAVAGQAVQFTVSGGTAGSEYRITCKCGSTATPPQLALEGRLVLTVY